VLEEIPRGELRGLSLFSLVKMFLFISVQISIIPRGELRGLRAHNKAEHLFSVVARPGCVIKFSLV
jgi:hypothetical protein